MLLMGIKSSRSNQLMFGSDWSAAFAGGLLGRIDIRCQEDQ